MYYSNEMTYKWTIEIASDVRALCKSGNRVLHNLVINDTPVSEEESEALAKTIIKMRALKDVLNLDWSSAEAAQYAVANAYWLDNKMLDAARKRWGAADYCAEKWLLAGAYLENQSVQDLGEVLSVTLELAPYIAGFKNDNNALGQINTLTMQSMHPESTRFGLLRYDAWVYCQGAFLQAQETDHAYTAMILSDTGLWQLMIVEKNAPHNGAVKNSEDPPSIDNVREAFISTPINEIEVLIAIK